MVFDHFSTYSNCSFFITLNFNNKSLYSPSDFTNETNFITTNIDRAHPQNGGSTHFTRSDVPAHKKPSTGQM